MHHNGRRSEHEAGTADERDDRRRAKCHAHARKAQRASADLQCAETEDLPPQMPQVRRPHLQPDDEKEHHHAELGELQDRVRIGEQAQPERPDQQTRRQVTQHRAEAEPPKQRDCDDGGA